MLSCCSVHHNTPPHQQQNQSSSSLSSPQRQSFHPHHVQQPLQSDEHIASQLNELRLLSQQQQSSSLSSSSSASPYQVLQSTGKQISIINSIVNGWLLCKLICLIYMYY